MSTVWRKAMVALGLGDDEDYEDYDDDIVQRPQIQQPQAGPAAVQPPKLAAAVPLRTLMSDRS